jgi:hypothetical protein
VFPLHVLYHLYNGVSFVAGTALFLAARRFGVSFPGALPPHALSPAEFAGFGATDKVVTTRPRS